MRVLLGLPFPAPLSERLMLISSRGRTSGQLYRQPVSYVQQDHLLLTPGGGTWKWSLQGGLPVRIRLRGQDVLARAALIEELDEIERLLAVMAAANPSVTAFVGIPKGPDGHLDRGHLELAVRYGFRIVRWRLGEEGQLAS
jgi:hypothetical protein